jgi:hypothetical protein
MARLRPLEKTNRSGFRVRSHQSRYFVPGRGAQKDLRHECGRFFEHVRIVAVVRIEVKWIAFEPDLSQSGPLARWSLLIRNGENHELLCVSRSAWGGSPRRSILHRFERWISDRNIQDVRGGYGVSCVERKN